MIFLKTDEEVELMRASNILLGKTYAEIAKSIQPGVSTAQLDKIAYEFIMDHGGCPACLGYEGYPATLCTSVNEQVVHGIPSEKQVLKEGDIVSIDSVIELNGWHSDSAYTFPVGEVSEEVMQLLRTTKQALYLGVEQAVTGRRIGDIGAAIQQYVEKRGYSVVRQFVGHGIGTQLHEAPEVPNFGTHGRGIRLMPGMTLAIEPMINAGHYDVKTMPDGWTVLTKDGSLSAHFEHTIVITPDGPQIMTKP